MFDDEYIFLVDVENNPMMLSKAEYLIASDTEFSSQARVTRKLVHCLKSNSSRAAPFELMLSNEVETLAKSRYLVALLTDVERSAEWIK